MRISPWALVAGLLLLTAACGSAADGPDTPQVSTDGRLAGRVTNEEWMFLGAGSPMTVGGTEQPLPWDGAMVTIELRVENRTGEAIPLRGAQFSVSGEEDQDVSTLNLVRKTDGGEEFARSVEVPPDSSTVVTLAGTLSPLPRILDAGRLRLVGSDFGWAFSLAPVPPGREKFADSIESGCYRSLEPRIVEQKWTGMAAGTSVEARGTKARIQVDVAGLELTLEVRNTATNRVLLSRYLAIASEENEPLAPLFLEKEGTAPRPIPGTGMAIEPGETVTLRLGSRMVGYDKLRAAGKLLLFHRGSDWRVPLEPLPEREALYRE